MSQKTRRLLHRSGRNQFGDPGQGMLQPYIPSQASVEEDARMVARHINLNEQFAAKYRNAWLVHFAGLSTREIFDRLRP